MDKCRHSLLLTRRVIGQERRAFVVAFVRGGQQQVGPLSPVCWFLVLVFQPIQTAEKSVQVGRKYTQWEGRTRGREWSMPHTLDTRQSQRVGQTIDDHKRTNPDSAFSEADFFFLDGACVGLSVAAVSGSPLAFFAVAT